MANRMNTASEGVQFYRNFSHILVTPSYITAFNITKTFTILIELRQTDVALKLLERIIRNYLW